MWTLRWKLEDDDGVKPLIVLLQLLVVDEVLEGEGSTAPLHEPWK